MERVAMMIPTYNSGRTLGETLTSLTEQGAHLGRIASVRGRRRLLVRRHVCSGGKSVERRGAAGGGEGGAQRGREGECEPSGKATLVRARGY